MGEDKARGDETRELYCKRSMDNSYRNFEEVVGSAKAVLERGRRECMDAAGKLVKPVLI